MRFLSEGNILKFRLKAPDGRLSQYGDGSTTSIRKMLELGEPKPVIRGGFAQLQGWIIDTADPSRCERQREIVTLLF